MLRKNRPKNVRSLHCYRCGPQKNHLEFLAAENERAYYLERPSGDDGESLARNWNYKLYRGGDNFNVGQDAIFRIYRQGSGVSRYGSHLTVRLRSLSKLCKSTFTGHER